MVRMDHFFLNQNRSRYSHASVPGAGALVAPLVATQFAQLRQWSFHYLASLGLALANTIALIVVFRFKTQDGPSVFHA